MKFLFATLFFFYSINLFSQDVSERYRWYNKLDSSNSDTDRVKIMYKLSGYYFENSLDSVKFFADKILSLSQKINYQKGLAIAYRIYGIYYDQVDSHPKALEFYLKSLKISEAGNFKDLVTKLCN